MEYTLNMVFLTTGGKKITLSVNDVSSTLTGSKAETLMDTILTENIFTTSSGDLATKSSANIVAKTVTAIKVV